MQEGELNTLSELTGVTPLNQKVMQMSRRKTAADGEHELGKKMAIGHITSHS